MAKTTSMLVFMPWCRSNKSYDLGQVEILPYERHHPDPIEGLDELAHCRVNNIMAMYKSIEAKPIDQAALIRWKDKSPIDVLSNDELDIVDDLITIACFAALSERQIFSPIGQYCNSDCFMYYAQKFDKADFVSLSSRRRAGRTMDGGWLFEEVAITIPVHCHSIDSVTIDEELLAALLKQRENDGEWARWQNAISCFNQANTDSHTFHHQVEWVLLCSAFEHLLGAKSEAKDVASKFAETLQPNQILLAKNADLHSERWQDDDKSLRYEWMREFYRIRGDFAHGKLNTQQPTVWNPLEHLVLAVIAFPLVVKNLLQQRGLYKLTHDDQAQIDCFEPLANTKDFLCKPLNQKHSGDNYWNRLLSKRKLELTISNGIEKVAKKLEKKHPDFFNNK